MDRRLRPAGVALMVFAALAPAARAQEKPHPTEGAWRQVEQRNGDAREYSRLPEDVTMIDYVVGGRFVWTIVQDGKVLSLAGGRCKADGEKFTEIVEYASGGDLVESFVGKSFHFTVTIDGDKLTKVGTIRVNGADYKIDEKWERCKP